MLLLNIPYSEKDEAKKLGARWNPQLKKWYVPNRKDYCKFLKWLEPNYNLIIQGNLYMIIGDHICFRCGKPTKVIAFATDKFIHVQELKEEYESLSRQPENRQSNPSKSSSIYKELHDGEIHKLGPINPVPPALLKKIQSRYNYKLTYSKTTKEKSFSNCCEHCHVLQGNFFLFQDLDSPFFIREPEDVRSLKIYKMPLKYDFPVEASIIYSSLDSMWKQYGRIIPLNVQVF